MANKLRNTVYRQYILQALWGMCVDGVGDFTIENLALYCGLNVTSNMRRQLHDAVKQGILYYDFSGGGRGGRSIHYSFANHWCAIARTAE
jgi:hypothetical protein